MIKNYYTPTNIDKTYKDPQIATNTCSSDSNCMKSFGMGKFFRKQDPAKIQKKRKAGNQQASLMCYLTPKNCQENGKLVKQKSEKSRNDIDSGSFLTVSNNDLSNKSALSVWSSRQKGLTRESRGSTSIQKVDAGQNKIISGAKNKKQSAEQYKVNGQTVWSAREKIQTRSFRYEDMKRQQQKEVSNQSSAKAIPASYEKQMKKLKNQCQHYSSLLQTSNKQRLECQTQIKSLTQLTNELKQKTLTLTKQNQELSRQILQLNKRLVQIKSQKDQFIKENNTLKDDKVKCLEEINYLKESINELNERIELMIEAEDELKLDSSRIKNTNLVTSTLETTHNNRRFNSLVMSGTLSNKVLTVAKESALTQEQNKTIHDLRNQLKYCQVELNMLRRVKMDINKKNEEFIKLQRQNKILKNQIFDMKTTSVIDESGVNNSKSAIKLAKEQQKSGKMIAQNSPNRNNFQISLQRGNRKDDKSSDRSSDTLSLNLSLSPERKH